MPLRALVEGLAGRIGLPPIGPGRLQDAPYFEALKVRMMFRMIRPFQYLWQALAAERTTSQLAWGIALGALIGVVPKGNLTAWFFGVVLCATRVNLGAGMLTALLVTGVSSFTDPLTHGIGVRLLSIQSFQAWLGTAHEWPLVPWLAWNNTVVLGSTVLGLALLYPIQHISRAPIERLQGMSQRGQEPEERPQEHVSQENGEASLRLAATRPEE